MKKVLNLSVMAAVLAATTLFSSCKKEDDNPDKPKPTLDVVELVHGLTGNNLQVEQGSTITFRWNAIKAGGGADLAKFSIAQQGTNVISPLPETSTGRTLPLESMSGGIRTQYVDTLVLDAGLNLGATTYTFRVEDRDGQVVTKAITVTVVEAETSTPFAKTETGEFFHVAGSKEGAYDLVTDRTVSTVTGSEDDMDLKNTDASGDAFTGAFTSGNNTQFVKVNSYDYANATVESAATAYAAGTASATVSAPAVDDIYIAKLRGGDNYAVIKVTALDPEDNTCNCGNKGKISFEYKKN